MGGGEFLSSIDGAPDGQTLWLMNNLGYDVGINPGGSGNIGMGGNMTSGSLWLMFYDGVTNHWHVRT